MIQGDFVNATVGIVPAPGGTVDVTPVRQRILFLSDWGGWGGAEKIILTLATRLDPQRFELHFVLGTPGRLHSALLNQGFSVEVLPMKIMTIPERFRVLAPFLYLGILVRVFLCAMKVAKVVRRVDPAIIQTCSLQAEILGAFVAFVTRRQWVWHVQAIQRPGFRRHLLRFLAGWVPTRIAATSGAVAEMYEGNALQSKLRILRAGIPDPAEGRGDKAECRARLDLHLGTTAQFVVIFASMILPGKGFHLLVEIASRVVDLLPNVVFLVAGEARFAKNIAYRDRVMKGPAARALGPRLQLLGFRSDVLDLIRAADCLIHCPTEYDAFPTTVLEGMALGTPVVGARIGGVPEQILDGSTGFLVDPGDADGFAGRVVRILTEPALAAALAKQARQRFVAEFTDDRFGRKFEDLYAEIV